MVSMFSGFGVQRANFPLATVPGPWSLVPGRRGGWLARRWRVAGAGDARGRLAGAQVARGRRGGCARAAGWRAGGAGGAWPARGMRAGGWLACRWRRGCPWARGAGAGAWWRTPGAGAGQGVRVRARRGPGWGQSILRLRFTESGGKVVDVLAGGCRWGVPGVGFPPMLLGYFRAFSRWYKVKKLVPRETSGVSEPAIAPAFRW